MRARSKAISDLRRFREMFSGILALAEDMEKVDSVEQATEEANSRLNEALSLEKTATERRVAREKEDKELDQVSEKHLASLAAHIAKLDQQAVEAETKAAEAGKDILAKAEVAAKDIVDKAEVVAKQTVAAALADGQRRVAEASQKAAISEARARDMETAVQKALAAVEMAEKERDRINAEIDQLLAGLKRR